MFHNLAIDPCRAGAHFSLVVVRPGFPKTGALELVFCKIFKRPKFELLKLKISIFSKNVWFLRGNVTFFFQMRVWTDLCLNWKSCAQQERREKEVLIAAHPCILFSGECSPRSLALLSERWLVRSYHDWQFVTSTIVRHHLWRSLQAIKDLEENLNRPVILSTVLSPRFSAPFNSPLHDVFP